MTTRHDPPRGALIWLTRTPGRGIGTGAITHGRTGTTVVLYAREVASTEPDPEPSLYLPDKWDGLEKALESDADVVAVAFPEVLGDYFTELVVNLGKIAESGKRLQILRLSPFLRMQTLVETDE